MEQAETRIIEAVGGFLRANHWASETSRWSNIAKSKTNTEDSIEKVSTKIEWRKGTNQRKVGTHQSKSQSRKGDGTSKVFSNSNPFLFIN